MARAQFVFKTDFYARYHLTFYCMACAAYYWFLAVSPTGFPYFTTDVQLLFSLNCFSVGTGFNGAETNCRIARSLGILLGPVPQKSD